mmetsp:Transcript_15829/g.34383  ORF Transcript_15829/g.34383 Transcript_15829/m.34383 type:complete len:103 (-) Transcript_15829:176-484(-)
MGTVFNDALLSSADHSNPSHGIGARYSRGLAPSHLLTCTTPHSRASVGQQMTKALIRLQSFAGTLFPLSFHCRFVVFSPVVCFRKFPLSAATHLVTLEASAI